MKEELHPLDLTLGLFSANALTALYLSIATLIKSAEGTAPEWMENFFFQTDEEIKWPALWVIIFIWLVVIMIIYWRHELAAKKMSLVTAGAVIYYLGSLLLGLLHASWTHVGIHLIALVMLALMTVIAITQPEFHDP